MIKDSGERTRFDTGAVRDMHTGKGRMDLLPWEALVEVSKHCEEGALKYGERNCEKGIPIHSLIDSAFRHLAKYMMGMKDEPHLRAACWNCLFALYMEIKHPELQDIPTRMRNRMNRAERRRAKKAGIPVKKEPVVNIKAADVQKIKQDASKEAADKAFLLMLGLPVMVLHDKFGFGPVRCERFTDAVLELYDSFEKGYVSLEDIHLTLKEETGITIVSDGRLKDRGN